MRNLVLLTLLVISHAHATPANPNAPLGGVFSYNLGGQPVSLNPLSLSESYGSTVASFVIESLGDRNIETYEWEPSLATSWQILKGGKEFVFELRKGVTWHDGKPFSAEDVKFSFDAIVDPKNRYGTAHKRPYYQGIDRVEILGPHKVKFVTKKLYFKNFDIAIGLNVLPKHLYQDTSKKNKRKLNKGIWGSGPYRFKRLIRGKYLELEANPTWWGRKDKSQLGKYNFAKIRFRFIQNNEMALRKLERGDTDFDGLSEEDFYRKTKGPRWGKEVFKVQVENQAAKSYGFIGLNLKHHLFKSKNVRKALYHLLNRKKMIKKFLYGNALLATGPWYRQSEYANPAIKPIPFDEKKARQLLAQEGWKDTDGDKILDKVIGGKKTKLSFTLLEPNENFIKYLTIFKEDAKKSGVEVKIKKIEWNTFLKLLDEKKFEAVRLGWGGGSIDVDPKQIWHSSSSASGGSNFISYNNKRVDRLIDEARKLYDKKKRIKAMRKVYKEIAEDIPYLFFFNRKSDFYGHTKRMKRLKDTYKYGTGFSTYWWIEK